MPKLNVQSKQITSANILEVHAGTNCPQGGDAGHGGRTLFRLTDRAGTSMWCRVNSGPLVGASRVEIVLGGDAECQTFTEALAFALDVLCSKSSPSPVKAAEENVE